ncbi:MAG: cytochrome c oxidase subunit II [Alphaproteobacteria bacterium]
MKLSAALAAFACLLPFGARAEAPHAWQMGFQVPASPNMQTIFNLNEALFVIISVIAAFVLVLLVYTIWRFSASRNPTPSKRAHNTLIEILWTIIPVMILVGIAVPSFKQLYFLGRVPANAELTIKAIGHQWYWSYQYPDNGDIAFDAFLVADDQLKPGQLRLLETDNVVVLPVETNIRIIVTADDVIHSWAVPALGVKMDAVPGRANETWMRIDRPGTYYGQCSELCGVNHGFMPIRIEAVSKDDFTKWAAEAKTKFGSLDAQGSAKLASATQQ